MWLFFQVDGFWMESMLGAILIWFEVENLVNVIDDDYDCLEPSMFDLDGVIVSLSMSPCGAHLAMGTTDGRW